MPTLIRLLITLIFLAGLVYAGMFVLVTFVEPTPKEVSQRIPTRELLGETEASRPAGNLPQPNVTSQPSTGQ
ncbi:histidine kinase [Devosia sp. XK-2]|uniref:histidine kinase n=1 Tax=Devosia sp. XK-2 TaxID=3126689 RepID=UPI0030CF684B